MPNPPKPKPNPKPWYKRIWFMTAAVIAAISVTLTQVVHIRDAVNKLVYSQGDVVLRDAIATSYFHWVKEFEWSHEVQSYADEIEMVIG
jgi:hypothetical protein